MDFALSAAGQERFAAWGYRPVDASVLAAHKADFEDPPNLFTIEDLGGWATVDRDLFDAEAGKVARIEEEAGVSTAK